MYEYFQLATKPKGYTKATLTTKYKYEQKTKLNNSNVEREDKLEVHETISSSALCPLIRDTISRDLDNQTSTFRR